VVLNNFVKHFHVLYPYGATRKFIPDEFFCDSHVLLVHRGSRKIIRLALGQKLEIPKGRYSRLYAVIGHGKMFVCQVC
jgi:hypothetical protein